MTIASYFLRHRRVLVLCGAAALLHYLLISWVGGHIGIAPAAAPAPPVIVAQLHAAPEPVAPAAPPAVAKPVTRPKPKPRRAPAPKPAAVAEAAPAPAPVPEPTADAAPADAMSAEPLATSGQAPAADAGSAAGTPPAQASAPESVPVPSSAPAADAVPATPPAALVTAYKASIPPSTDLTLDVARTDADGTVWHGQMVMGWHVKDGAYSMKVEAGISMLITRLNLVVLTSEGRVDASGFVPATMTEKRRGRALTATHFNRERQQITFSASEAVYALEAGAQDKATLPLQLAGIARADPEQMKGAITIQVGEDKDAIVYRFDVLGQEEIDTRLGKLPTWHLSRPPKPGVYGSRLDVWLAPTRDWMPVRVRNVEASGAVTTQTVSKIVSTESGQ